MSTLRSCPPPLSSCPPYPHGGTHAAPPPLQEIRHLQQEDSQSREQQDLQLVIDLPSFPHAVLYQQPMSYTAATQAGGSVGGGGSSTVGAKAESGGGAGTSAAAAAAAGAAAERLQMENMIVLHDPEVGVHGMFGGHA